jgi:hypothetical protein
MLRSPAEPTAITAVSKLRHAVERDDVSFRSLLATAPSGRPKVAAISLSLSRLGWRKAPGDVWATKLRPICDFVKTWVEESSWKCWSDWPVNSTEWEGCDGHNSAFCEAERLRLAAIGRTMWVMAVLYSETATHSILDLRLELSCVP